MVLAAPHSQLRSFLVKNIVPYLEMIQGSPEAPD